MLNIWVWVICLCVFSVILIVLYIRQALGIKRELTELNERIESVENKTNEGISSYESLQQLISDEANPKLSEALSRLLELRERIHALRSNISSQYPYAWYRSSSFHKSVIIWTQEEQQIHNLVQSELRLIHNISSLNSHAKGRVKAVKDELDRLFLQWQNLVTDTGLPLSRIRDTFSSMSMRLQEAEAKYEYDKITSESMVTAVKRKQRQLEMDLNDVRPYCLLLLNYQRDLEMTDQSVLFKNPCTDIYHHLLHDMSEGDMDSVRKLYKQAESCLQPSRLPTEKEGDLKESLKSDLQHMEWTLQQIHQERSRLEQNLINNRQRFVGIRYNDLNTKVYHIDSEIKHIVNQIPQLYLKLENELSELEQARVIIELYNRKLQETQQTLHECTQWIQEIEDQIVMIRREFSNLEDKYVSILLDLGKREVRLSDNRILFQRQEQINELLIEMTSLLTKHPYQLDQLLSNKAQTNDMLHEFMEEANRQIRNKDRLAQRLMEITSYYNGVLEENDSIQIHRHRNSYYENQLMLIKKLMRQGLFLEADRELDQLEEMIEGIQREYSPRNDYKNLGIFNDYKNG